MKESFRIKLKGKPRVFVLEISQEGIFPHQKYPRQDFHPFLSLLVFLEPDEKFIFFHLARRHKDLFSGQGGRSSESAAAVPKEEAADAKAANEGRLFTPNYNSHVGKGIPLSQDSKIHKSLRIKFPHGLGIKKAGTCSCPLFL